MNLSKNFQTLILLGFCLLLINSQQSFAQAGKKNHSSIINIDYGKSGRITYNVITGKIAVSQNSKQILYNGLASGKQNGQYLTAQNYKRGVYKKRNMTDSFGKGIEHTITFSAADLPTLKHVFYTYPDRDYFLTELVLQGDSINTNYMAPLLSDFNNLSVNEDQRSLFMPFDNDAFVRYNARKFEQGTQNISSEAGAVYDEVSGNGIVIGSVEHQDWKSGIKTEQNGPVNRLEAWSGYTDKDVTRDELPHGFISGDSVRSPKFFVGYFEDWRTGLEEYGKANRIAEPPVIFNWHEPTPIGWNSWGVLQQKINYQNTTAVVDFFADSLSSFKNDGAIYIDLDSFWDNMVKGGLEGDYSELKKFSEYCKAKGVQPGIYWAPFTDWGHKAGGSRRAEGSQFTFGEMWTKINDGFHDFDGARALDPTHPGTRARIKFVVGKLKECGFKMIKIDFLGHAAVESSGFYDKNVRTGMQAYRAGMEYLIQQLDDKMLVYAAISPNLASGRYVHVRRIACDAWKTIKDTEYTLNSVSYGWWQTYLYNYIDADHVVLANESEGENRARVLSAVITGTFITGDDFSKAGPWSSNAKKLFQIPELLQVVKYGKAFRPIYGNTGTGASSSFSREINGYCYLAVFNFEDGRKDIYIDFKKAGLSSEKIYTASEIFSGEVQKVGQKMKFSVAPRDAVFFKIKI